MRKIPLIKVGDYIYKCIKHDFGYLCICINDEDDWFIPTYQQDVGSLYPIIGYVEE